MSKSKEKPEEPIVIEDGLFKDAEMQAFVAAKAIELAISIAPSFPQRNPERVSEFCVETVRQIIERSRE